MIGDAYQIPALKHYGGIVFFLLMGLAMLIWARVDQTRGVTIGRDDFEYSDITEKEHPFAFWLYTVTYYAGGDLLHRVCSHLIPLPEHPQSGALTVPDPNPTVRRPRLTLELYTQLKLQSVSPPVPPCRTNKQDILPRLSIYREKVSETKRVLNPGISYQSATILVADTNLGLGWGHHQQQPIGGVT